ncbi:MAG: bifunctional phosphoribosyl-AMP cyclohydrolase/phosphoribosyl-ATP diphosphatase HisIE [Acidobacteria bacterium]|nr:bifunctional phosphoribosyl-AMP cyclohydrolase/phosphoribosyl-ATP diphosphatase HisIE [Acidobacteriota bacterium]
MKAETLRFDDSGLIPCVVQDNLTGAVLMVAWMNAEAVDLTQTTGDVHFWSRSRNELWRKGATSGNTLRLVSITEDCDADTLLVRAVPAGPTCHTGATTCFGTGSDTSELSRLFATIEDRIADPPPDSYTAGLVAQGIDAVGRKVTEEATEVLIAAKNHDSGNTEDDNLAEEAADLVYHLFVTLASQGVSLNEVLEVLHRRAT